MWKGANNVQVYDMNGFFLFEFQTVRMAEHVIMGDWKRQSLINQWSADVYILVETKLGSGGGGGRGDIDSCMVSGIIHGWERYIWRQMVAGGE